MKAQVWALEWDKTIKCLGKYWNDNKIKILVIFSKKAKCSIFLNAATFTYLGSKIFGGELLIWQKKFECHFLLWESVGYF